MLASAHELIDSFGRNDPRILVFDVIRIVALVTRGAFVPIEVPISSAEGHTALDQTSGGGDISRSTSTIYTSLGGAGWRFKYVAADRATIATVRFASVFTSAVTGSTYGEVCLWDIDAGIPIVSLTNPALPDTTPAYKDVDFDISLLVDGHTYEPRYHRVGPTTANVYIHKFRMTFHMGPWSKALVPYRCGKGGTAGVSRMKMPGNDEFLAGSVAARYVEAFGTTDPGQHGQGNSCLSGCFSKPALHCGCCTADPQGMVPC